MTSAAAGGRLGDFTAQLPFPLDPFQQRACEALEAGHGVLVCAPTGAGKTVVGEFAVHLALAGGRKCFYTTPIKALSNQKYNDLVARYGKDAVGLLTGDQSVNSEAPAVVMTTEVLRNMLYANSPTLRGLSHVVMDEVHFLADRFRGAVWEEVILHLPEEVRLVSLSATVSNAEEFGAWMETVRGDTTVIVDETRPVPLWQHVMVGGRVFDLFENGEPAQPRGGKVLLNGELLTYIRKRLDSLDAGGDGRGRGGGYRERYRPGGGYRPPARPEVINTLDLDGLLPAITFIFSRAGCDAAVLQCLRGRVRLTTDEEAARIRAIIDKHTCDIPAEDLAVLGYAQWCEALQRGIAAHHAGMLPVFRHTVEELFVKGLVRAVFATETLALGINMPARTVVLEKLVKFNGDTHAELTPGEYTQLTGRAGRRGIDVEGHAVVLWQPGLDPKALAGLASTRTFPLRSSFAPEYNMAINLVRQVGVVEARALLERSFAQFQADRSVVGMARSVERATAEMARLAERMDCHLGDFAEYARMRRALTDRERDLERGTKAARVADVERALAGLRFGDIVAVTAGKRTGLAVVVEADRSVEEPRPLVVTDQGWCGLVGAADFAAAPGKLGALRLPKHVDHRSARVRRDLASALRGAGIAPPRRAPKHRSTAPEDRELAALRRALRDHPCHGCPEREEHARWGERHARLEREAQALRQRMTATTTSLVRTFDRIVALLVERDYLDPDAEQVVTEEGERLSRIYCESDLLVAEALRRGVWKGLGAPELAAVVSTMVYEARRDGEAMSSAPTEPLRRALADTRRLWEELHSDESRHRLNPTREPDDGFVRAAYLWTSGAPLAEVLAAAGTLTAGDFVRWCRQVLDLLNQVRSSSPDKSVRSAAGKAVEGIRRGVVAVEADD